MMNIQRKRKRKYLLKVITKIFQNNLHMLFDDLTNQMLTKTLPEEAIETESNEDTDISDMLNGDDCKCKKNIRISFRAFRRLYREVNAHDNGWATELETLVFLLWLAFGANYQTTSNYSKVSPDNITNIVNKFLKYFFDNTSTFIKLPDEHELFAVRQGFAEIGKSTVFLMAAGAIGECSISIRHPVDINQPFIKQLRYSIKLQAVSDHTGKFIDIFSGHSGNVNDQHQRILLNSPLYLEGSYPPNDYFLIADNAYSLMSSPIKVLTPFQDEGLTIKESKFNYRHSMVKNVVTKSFAMMKMRWHLLFDDPEIKIKDCRKVIAACCVLHNICCMENDIFEPDLCLITSEITNSEELEKQETELDFRRSLCEEINKRTDL